MDENVALQESLWTSVVGLLVLCLIVTAVISAGIWLLEKAAARRRDEWLDRSQSAECNDEMTVHLEIGDCRPDCGCEKPCVECE